MASGAQHNHDLFLCEGCKSDAFRDELHEMALRELHGALETACALLESTQDVRVNTGTQRNKTVDQGLAKLRKVLEDNVPVPKAMR